MLTGQGKSLTIAVLSICLALLILILFLIARRVEEYLAVERAQALVLMRSSRPVIADNPASWFPMDAYPAAAQRRSEQGRVVVVVRIASDGTPSNCRIVASSGSTTLDQTTCALVLRNGRFEPARAEGGQKVASSWQSPGVRWVLPN